MSDRLANRDDRWDNRQDRWEDRRGRWDDWHNNHYHYHNHWHHGHWHGYWHPGARWSYWWDNYPVMTAFGVTRWAVNRSAWAFGYYSYNNPYVSDVVYVDSSYNYSQPIVMMPDETSLSGDPETVAPEPVSDTGLSSFDEARVQFYGGQYKEALASTEAALKEIPNDAVIHEFRALVLFAMGQYNDSAATLYAVLGVGPGWDWTTMSGLYADVATYTDQLRKLEAHCNENSGDAAARFVLAYHYMTAGHDSEAEQQLQALVVANPADSVSRQLLLQLNPDAEIPNPPQQVKPPAPENPAAQKELVGSWSADRDDQSFEMTLDEDSKFAWNYKAGDQEQEVTGVWGVDQDGVLALEMNDGGVMLAQTNLTGSKLDFYMLGDTQGREPLHFSK